MIACGELSKHDLQRKETKHSFPFGIYNNSPSLSLLPFLIPHSTSHSPFISLTLFCYPSTHSFCRFYFLSPLRLKSPVYALGHRKGRKERYHSKSLSCVMEVFICHLLKNVAAEKSRVFYSPPPLFLRSFNEFGLHSAKPPSPTFSGIEF